MADTPLATTENVAHLLRRTEYVVRPNRHAALTNPMATIESAVDAVLAFSPVPVPLPSYIDHDIDGEGYQQWVYAVQWWIDRMAFDSPTPMQEKMTWFFHGHFCSSWDKVNSARLMMGQNKLFRDNALGNFRALTHAVSLQPAMLFYLDNVYNVVGEPNQNFARELMELFTMGVGNYTEGDVAAAAAAWTGHGVDWDTYDYKFRPASHDGSVKVFMNQSRPWDGPQIIDYILSENTVKKLVTCKFLTRKLWEFFAYQNPSQTLVDELAQVLFDNDLAIAPWVKAMLLRPEFYSAAAVQGLVRSPVDFVAALQYYSGLRGAVVNPQWSLDGMGQEPFSPPNVAGWKTNGYWVNTSLFGGRADFARGVTWRLREGDAHDIGALSPEAAVDQTAAMFGLSLTTATRNALLGYMQVQRTNEPWGGWWESTNILTMAMLAPEFHLA